MNVTQGALVGLASGLSVAIGGAIKDAPYEGFNLLKFLRSPIIGLVEGAVISKLITNVNPYLLYFSVIGTERITTETYKLLRATKPMKFTYGEYGLPKITI